MELDEYFLKDILMENLHQDESFDQNDSMMALCQYNRIGMAGLKLPLIGSRVWKSPSDVTGLNIEENLHITAKSPNAAMFDLIMDNMRHLTPKETSGMLERLCPYDEKEVHAVLNWLLKVYEPNLTLSAKTSPWTLDFSRCSPLVGRLLACYDGTVGDSDLSDDDEDTDSDDDEEDDGDDLLPAFILGMALN